MYCPPAPPEATLLLPCMKVTFFCFFLYLGVANQLKGADKRSQHKLGSIAGSIKLR
jgi:hypothetical protein